MVRFARSHRYKPPSLRVESGKLVVTGENFGRGAKIVVNLRRFKDTKRDRVNPTTVLTSKTADRAVAPALKIVVSVINRDGRQSPGVLYGAASVP